MLKGQKGITLVALVITIIVLLILAGVSISLVMGENGVLTQAQGAVVAQKIGGAKEKVESAVAAMEMKYKTDWAKNTSATRTDTYAGKDASGVTNTTLVAFKTELKANGLDVASTPTEGQPATGAEGTIAPGILATPDATSGEYAAYTTVYFTSGTDSFKVTMVVNNSTGEVVFDEFLAWNGNAYVAE